MVAAVMTATICAWLVRPNVLQQHALAWLAALVKAEPRQQQQQQPAARNASNGNISNTSNH
eukprot:CAMPEP_0172786822 /NCGR_PEP_ID=MMETSP1074-20121228/206141_1 /TAXON_ID=2916 /ORGANISM="Ceratium fusus, Strain PA161109" /LENGTH=60 /DNA_ID=CAMNT_0013623837 /DNA_START=40 /DNA_END=222 /DNA_ORIENTATION=+